MKQQRMSREIVLHVCASATGEADGSVSHPYPTLAAARDAVRARRRQDGLVAPVRVLVAPGVYRLDRPLVLTPEDGGTAECPVTWSGQGGRPLVSGARVISGWQEGSINDRPCWQTHLPEVAAGKWWFTQLFVNGRRQWRARLPKQGFYRFTGVPDDEAASDPGSSFHGAMRACFAPGEVRDFQHLGEIDVVVPDHWYENHLRLAAVNEASHILRFSTKGWSRFSRDETRRHTRYRLDHVMEGCTEPGEWYLDRSTGTLSYIPVPGEEIATTLIEAPSLDLLLSIQGDALNAAQRVRHLRIEFFDLRHADWELPRTNPGALQSAMNVPAAVRLVGAEDCALYGCRVSQVAGWAVEVLRGCHCNRVVACALHDLGGGGVKIGHEGGLPTGWAAGPHSAFRDMNAAALGWGPNREEAGGLLPGRDHAEPSATTVSDCSIHDGGLIFHSAVGVWIGDASRNRVVHNHIWNFNYSGISCGWTWGYAPAFTCDNRIEGNHIHGIGHGMLSDMGAIYILGRQAGTTIRRNYIHGVHSYGYGGWGIYTDEGSSWIRIEENVVCGTKSGGFHQHYGRDNLVRHNVFVDAIDGQVQLSRQEMMGSLTFQGNLVQGAGNGKLLAGAGWVSARSYGNVYAGDLGRPALFAEQTWEQWRAAGDDTHGRLIEALLLDAGGGAPVAAHPAALTAAGIDPRRVARVIANAGIRFRATLPPTIDAVRPEPETRRALVESCFWPWPVEWPGEHPWGSLPPCAIATRGGMQPISLTLENRGDARAVGRYRLKVTPAGAARIIGPKAITVALEPGERTALETAIVATGKVKHFRVEAIAAGKDLISSSLYFAVGRAAPALEIPRLAALPDSATMGDVLEAVPAQALEGNGSAVTATVRLAVAQGHLLMRIDTNDAAPSRGVQPWDGSSIELFTAPSAGAPRRQLVAAPPLGGAPAVVLLATTSGMIVPEGVLCDGALTSTGWTLTLSVPLAVLGLDPNAATFAVDQVVNATAPGESILCRTNLAGEFNPYLSSDRYVKVTVGETGAASMTCV